MGLKVVYPGTFDPVTMGHLDLIQRASGLFDEVVVAIAHSPSKKPWFSLEERRSMLEECTKELTNVRTVAFSHLLVDLCKELDVRLILRGVRMVSDFEYELQLATMNRKMVGNLETIFLTPAEDLGAISSTLVREIVALSGDVSGMVPVSVEQALRDKARSRR